MQLSSSVPATQSTDPKRDAFSRLAKRWIRVQLENGPFDEWVLSHVTAGVRLVPESRMWPRAPEEPEREPDTWREVDAYELLFSNIAHQGAIPEGCEPDEFLALVKSFAAWLGEHGIIPPEEHGRLQAEYDLWAERLLQVWESGGWYSPSGQRLVPDPLPSDDLVASAVASTSERRSGRVPVSDKRRRQKKAQRKARRKGRR